MRKALMVGINNYRFGMLTGCIADANNMVNILSRDFDGSPNFSCKKLISSETEITIDKLKQAIIDLFSHESDVALFYFSGHGSETTHTASACLVTQDATKNNDGVELDFLMNMANRSKAREVVIILDCCYGGALGNSRFLENIASLREGVSILTSSHQSQVSMDTATGGVFTSIVYDALSGGAADVLGLTTVASVYSYSDKLLGAWNQRPIFKSYVSKMISLRKCKPSVSLEILRKLPAHFASAHDKLQLDASFEPDAEPRGHPNEKIFADLQKYNKSGLLSPIDEDHMYFAAINNKACELTPLGKYYWKLANEEKI